MSEHPDDLDKKVRNVRDICGDPLAIYLTWKDVERILDVVRAWDRKQAALRPCDPDDRSHGPACTCYGPPTIQERPVVDPRIRVAAEALAREDEHHDGHSTDWWLPQAAAVIHALDEWAAHNQPDTRNE